MFRPIGNAKIYKHGKAKILIQGGQYFMRSFMSKLDSDIDTYYLTVHFNGYVHANYVDRKTVVPVMVAMSKIKLREKMKELEQVKPWEGN